MKLTAKSCVHIINLRRASSLLSAEEQNSKVSGNFYNILLVPRIFSKNFYCVKKPFVLNLLLSCFPGKAERDCVAMGDKSAEAGWKQFFHN